jgi:uncharacterized protein (TIGR03066 family)
MRAVIASVAVLVGAGFVGSARAADEQVDVKKLIGKWEPTNFDKNGPAMVLEIADKGAFALHVTSSGKTVKVDGTYTVTGNKIDVEMTFNGKKMKDTLTVVKLTDTELVTKGTSDKEETMKRVKDQ